MLLDDEHRDLLRSALLGYINTYCVFRCNPSIQYIPGIPKGKLPGKAPGAYVDWQLFPRRIFQNSDLASAASLLLLDMMHFNEEPKEGVQIAGIETSSIPMIASFTATARLVDKRYYDSFIVRKERKNYGVFNLIDGLPNHSPVMVMDDIHNSGGSMMQVLEAALYEFNLDPHPHSYYLINSSPRTTHRVFNGTHIKINAIFDLNEIDTKFSEEKYWIPEDCRKDINFRPDYH